MPVGFYSFPVETAQPPKIGRPRRDRARNKAARAARRRNRP